MPMKLSGSDRRIFKTMTSFPWDPEGGPSFYEAVEDRMLSDPGTIGIARRIIHDDPTEIVRFGCLGLRKRWRDYLSFKSSEARCLWHSCIGAFAINDFAAIDRIVAEAPAAAPETDSSPFPVYYDAMYNLFFGILRGDHELAACAVHSMPKTNMPTYELAVADCLVAIFAQSPPAFSKAMTAICTSVRKIRAIDPHYKLIDLTTHGVWELAFRVSPAAVELWDVQHPLPWDAELHTWLRKGLPATDVIDDAQLSEAARDLLKMPSSA